MQLRHIHYFSSIGLLAIGGALVVAGLPYAISHYGCGVWCEGMSVYLGPNEPIERILSEHPVFELFLPFGLIILVIGTMLYVAYKVELRGIPNP